MSLLRASIAVLLPLQAAADFRALCAPFAYGYMDPIVTPGRLAGHLHHIAGSLGFSPDTINPGWLRNNATTCDRTPDHSNYWVPAMYRTDLPGGPQLMVPFIDPYYEFDTEDVPYLNASVISDQPMNMILGKASGANATDKFRILFLARSSGSTATRTETPSGRFGFHTDISDVKEYLIVYRFPSCWNGGVYQADQSHLVYPDPITNRCPSDYPYQFPRLRIEQKYILDTPIAWSNGSAPFYFSSGPESTAHADAVVFWEKAGVQQLFDGCGDVLAQFCLIGTKQATSARMASSTTYYTPDKYLAPSGFVPATWSLRPTPSPTPSPTRQPTNAPTRNPTSAPTEKPTKSPTAAPTERPTKSPTTEPTPSPTFAPTFKPSRMPTPEPTMKPSKTPTATPTSMPTTLTPTRSPTVQPTMYGEGY